MSLALVLYNTKDGDGKVELLILDEPDASLHPSMSKLMLKILEEEIVKKLSIPVVISTHSPTTIACAPAYSLYKITKENKKPEKCNLEDSIGLLSYSIPNLRVSVEARRQVFVESVYDVMYYESLFAILSRHHNFSTQPQFIPPHIHKGSNCSDVISITQALRDLGNTQIYGLIDWDGKNNEEEQLIILGFKKRYAIENYIFEPHLLGLYLVYKDFVGPEEFGINDCHSYRELLNKIDISILQKIIDSIEDKFFSDGSNQRTGKLESELISGGKVMVDSTLFRMQGHSLEEKYKTMWPKLQSVRDRGDSAIKADLINTTINDFSEFLSKDILNTFEEFK